MNNVFLYAARDTLAYRQVEAYLTRISFNASMIILPPSTQFYSPACLELRSNDFIILFAETDEDINELLSLNDEYESFRIILILKSEDYINTKKLINLSPRMIAYLDKNIDDVGNYLINIFR
ncbi:MAG: hypothetical protein JZU50_01910 [Desulfobulbaceae bacterium]|nr:hypothetical protein [Desulfobulbaceae bacterium]